MLVLLYIFKNGQTNVATLEISNNQYFVCRTQLESMDKLTDVEYLYSMFEILLIQLKYWSTLVAEYFV